MYGPLTRDVIGHNELQEEEDVSLTETGKKQEVHIDPAAATSGFA